MRAGLEVDRLTDRVRLLYRVPDKSYRVQELVYLLKRLLVMEMRPGRHMSGYRLIGE